MILTDFKQIEIFYKLLLKLQVYPIRKANQIKHSKMKEI